MPTGLIDVLHTDVLCLLSFHPSVSLPLTIISRVCKHIKFACKLSDSITTHVHDSTISISLHTHTVANASKIHIIYLTQFDSVSNHNHQKVAQFTFTEKKNLHCKVNNAMND